MKKQFLLIGLLALGSTSAFANVDNTLEILCSSQGGAMTSLSQGGTVEFLTDGSGVTHQRFSMKDKVVNIELNNLSDQVKSQIIDSVKFGYDLELCMTPEGNVIPMMARISTEHK
ncbi:hypothetical protein [Photobacterium damselae]|uniref:hypothetical protein n=1 Tax=Photobacterium damselae TaxID=38293 RepID=UPI000D662482|nr:hypothetical protein [Photobacterium damselae]AWK84130.1 hypothetical protein BST98_19325 [Photobacterium damselae]MCG3815986.1 hypothetical protein [Photobacterium damselae]